MMNEKGFTTEDAEFAEKKRELYVLRAFRGEKFQ
jgi:hypothetical protein